MNTECLVFTFYPDQQGEDISYYSEHNDWRQARCRECCLPRGHAPLGSMLIHNRRHISSSQIRVYFWIHTGSFNFPLLRQNYSSCEPHVFKQQFPLFIILIKPYKAVPFFPGT